MAAWYANTNSLYAEYMQRLENVDAAYKLGLYESKADADLHKDRIDVWYNEMFDIMSPVRAA